ncbi:unnamed protein product, partial [Brenthis ino]
MSGDDSDDDNVILYGTPLEPFEEDEVPTKKKYQQQQDQYAVDDHGRRRFHGAFTGGFSAGFGNTVGTPEGWTPSSFKSSRSEKAQVSNQRPEDYMDEEDRSEFGIAPRHLQTKNEFSGQKRPHQKSFHDGPIPGEPVLGQLIRAVHETAAVKILRKMGWKPGQGVGDRVSHGEKKKAKEQHKVYGCYMPPEMMQQKTEQSDSSDSEFEYDTLFAPDDYEPYILVHKNDKFGIGYKGLSRHSVLGNLIGEYGEGSSSSHLKMKEKGKKVSIRGQAFGVGAFEADDEDIYATEDMSHYDFAIGGKEKEIVKKSAEKSANVLEGFMKAKKPQTPISAYPPPALPRDFAPAPAGLKRSRFEPTEAIPRDQGLGRHELTAEARGALLGETSRPKTQKTQETDETQQMETQTQNPDLSKILGKTINLSNTQGESSQNNKELDFISIKDSGKDVRVFKPFMSDPEKQARYERFLENKVLEKDGNKDRLSEWERNRERLEFEQAAKLYKPLSGIIGERFTHASEPDEALNPLSSVAKSSINRGLATPEQIEAAKIGAYGVMTRSVTTWRPKPLAFKRFNLRDLDGNRIVPKKEDKPKASVFSYAESSVHNKESFTKEQSKFRGSKSLVVEPIKNNSNKEKENTNVTKISAVSNTTNTPSEVNNTCNKRMTVAELFLKESEKDLKEKDKGTEVVQTIEKFDKMDLYKSIFLSDSEDEIEEVNKEETTNSKDYMDKPKNVERNLSPPRGIFANIDFDELNSWKRRSDDKNNETQTKCSENDNKERDGKDKTIEENKNGSMEVDAVYGPKIPDNIQKRLQSELPTDSRRTFRKKVEREIEGSSSSSDSWVEAKELKSKKQKKKSKKQKSKNLKSKRKNKK